jgi:glycosyltransferase involved in cell wall biosynthesis
MKLSIVIPAYNEEAYIADCLESVLKEVASASIETEVIVVNNASTDRTKEIALSYPGVIVVDEPKKSLTMARQAGFKASTGDLIANIDADTLMPPGWIAKVQKEFSKNKDLAALSGPYIYYDRSRLLNVLVWSYYFLGYLMHLVNHRLLKIGAMLQGGNFILKRIHLEEIGGFDTSIEFYGEDTDIARRIQKTGRVKFSFLLPMRTSGRRLSKEGLIATSSKYIINHFWIIVFKRPFRHRYTHVGGSKTLTKDKE